MVQLTKLVLTQVKHVYRKKLRGTYLDKVHVNVEAGSGGMGNQKFGGIGGKGGDVYMEASAAQDLSPVVTAFPERCIKAGKGGNSVAKQLLGIRGNDITVKVPCGVRAITDERLIIGEVNTKGEKLILAKGGIGGNPSTNFCGVRGQKLNITFELSLIADVGLLGFPNAGKSTLLKACSHAKPRIAAYPFTTVKPNVGIVQYEDFRKITMADLPGLIEGAHANRGMGHKFLRHIERAKLVLMVIDVNGFQLNIQGPKRSAFETIMLLNKELELYNPDYLDKPMALIVNKMDTPGATEVLDEIRDKLLNINEVSRDLPDSMKCEKLVSFEEIIGISAIGGKQEAQIVRSHIRSSLERISLSEQSDLQEEVKQKLVELKQKARESGPVLI